jgi:hypothetical protein
VTTTSVDIRARIVDVLRRDLIGPLPERVWPRDVDLQRERLSDSENDRPSRWYLAGFLAPADDAAGMEAEDTEQPELVDGDESGAKLRLVDLQLLSTPLKSGLGLDDAGFDGLDAIAPGQRFPRAGAMSLEDDIGIEEDRR